MSKQHIFVYNLSGGYSHTSEASNMLFLSICHGANSLKNHIFVCRFHLMDRKKKFQLVNKGLSFDILLEHLA